MRYTTRNANIDKGAAVPWRNGPDFWQFIQALAAMLIATAAGAIAKIADDVKTGNRKKFWSRQLWLDIPAVLMMMFIAWGVAEQYDLAPGVGAALGSLLGWAGPRAVDVVLARKLRIQFRQGDKDR